MCKKDWRELEAYRALGTPEEIESKLGGSNKFSSGIIYHRAIEVYGHELQQVVAMEELSELQKEIAKAIRKGSVPCQNDMEMAEEMADVEIMLDQLRIIHRIDRKTVDSFKGEKLQRLANRLEQEKVV